LDVSILEKSYSISSASFDENSKEEQKGEVKIEQKPEEVENKEEKKEMIQGEIT